MPPRFFIERLLPDDRQVRLGPNESFHARRVLRLKVGDPVEVFDGQCCRAGFIASQDSEGVSVGLTHASDGSKEVSQERRLSFELDLVFALIKSEAAELIIQKACELGVSAIYPVVTQRSVVRLSAERRQSKSDRWTKIVIAACKQCGRSQVPRIAAPQPLKDWLPLAGGYDRVFIPTLAIAARPLREAARIERARKVAVLIGPEGDFTPEEARQAVEAGAVAVSLGPIVMRAETAALYTAAALHFYYGGQYGEDTNVD